MTARWQPSNVELDAVARELPPFEPTRERAEQGRAALLGSAAGRTQVARRSFVPWAIAGAALAAAAAVAIWIGVRPREHAEAPIAVVPTPKQVITPIGVARFERVTDWADFVVRLDDGKVDVRVAQLDVGERFRVKTADAEAETRGASFDIGADQGRLASVDVRTGRVEIRRIGQESIFLSAGERWRPTTQTATIDLPPAPPTVAAPTPPPSRPRKIEVAPSPTVETPKPAAPSPPPTKPGEAEFRAGMAALRSGDARAAAVSFAAACTIARNDALGEDACFWSGAAARRAGDTATARAALSSFVQQFPKSPRVPEAAALLGWIAYEAGDLYGAEQLFRRAEHDRVPSVRDSAQRGLTAISRKRGGSP